MRRNLLIQACLIVGLFVAASQSQAKSIYVNNRTGLNTNSGAIDTNQGAKDGPVRTIAAALKRAERGDRIVLADTGSAYEECITLQGAKHSGNSFAPFVIEGNGATLDGSAPVPPENWEFLRGQTFQFRPARGGTQRLFLDGELAKQLFAYNGRYIDSKLKPKHWSAQGGAINFAVEKGKHPNSYDLRYAKHTVGITLYDVRRVIIRDLTVRGFQLDGINAHDNAMDCLLSEVSCVANGRSGISVGGASRLQVADSTARDNGQVQIRGEGWSTTRMNRTKLVSYDGPLWSREANWKGQGARVFIDDEKQTFPQGWTSKAELERREKLRLEGEAGDQEPLEDVADERESNPKADEEDAGDSPLLLGEDVVNPMDESGNDGGDVAPDDTTDPFGDDLGDDLSDESDEQSDAVDVNDPFGDGDALFEDTDDGPMDENDPFGDI